MKRRHLFGLLLVSGLAFGQAKPKHEHCWHVDAPKSTPTKRREVCCNCGNTRTQDVPTENHPTHGQFEPKQQNP